MEHKTSSIDWNDVIKKEARVTDDSDFGEVQEVGPNYVLTQRGMLEKERYYVPKYLVYGYDGHTLWFDVGNADVTKFKRDTAPQYEEYATQYKKTDMPADVETRIPLIEERLDVSKKVKTDEVTIAKEPVTETKTIEVPVTHEEVRVERRPASADTVAETARPVEARTEVNVPVTSEEVEVTKRPYVKEEVVVTKEPVTETETVSDTVRSEKVVEDTTKNVTGSRKEFKKTMPSETS